jgi:hypothetical protein
MRDRLSGSMVVVAIAAAVLGAAVSVPVTLTSAQAPAASGAAPKASPLQTAPLKTPPLQTAPLKTPWGEPDLQGIWTDEFDTPFQRSAQYATQEFFTEVQRRELDRQREAHYGNDPRQERGSAVDVGGS